MWFTRYRYCIMRQLVVLCLLSLLLATVGSKAIVGNKVIVALNCGSKDESVDANDKVFKYEPDERFVGGNSVPVDYHSNQQATDTDIMFTFEKRLYMFERHTYSEMTYSLPLKKGTVTLILKFAEMYFTSPGQRVFNIKIGSKFIRKDFDVVQKTKQRYAAHEEYIELEVKTDGVYYEGAKVPGAVTGNKLKLTFAKGKADNPIVQGIILYHDSIDNSPQADFQYLRKSWDKQKELQKAMKEEEKLKEIIAIQKKKEKMVIRNDQLIIEKPEESSGAQVVKQKYGFVRRLLMGPVGILLWSFLFAVGLFVVYSKVLLMGEREKGQSVKE